jgi:hypothetical protein
MVSYIYVPIKTTDDKWIKLYLPIDFLCLPNKEWVWCDISKDAYPLQELIHNTENSLYQTY